MTFSFVRNIATLFLVAYAGLAIAQPSIKSLDQSFTYDASQPHTATTKAQVAKIEGYIAHLPAYGSLSANQRFHLGKLAYKLGSYYSHAAHQPSLAIEKFDLADSLLTGRHEKADLYREFAFAYKQQYLEKHDVADSAKADFYMRRLS